MTDARQWFVTCPRGMEGLLAAELGGLGAEAVKESVSGVAVSGPVALGYRACLWSRLANRVLLVLLEAEVDDGDQLYHAASAVDWSAQFDRNASIAVDFIGTWGGVRHTVFGAQRVKDAIVDHFRAIDGARPGVDVADPD
ncbi:MAG: 23S rRNA (guanine(2445)-N(2))/(guanine(2069)-N(7))-methyltransferase, partial [Porticoccaceae bacterium]